MIAKPNATASVWEYFGFKPNEQGEPINTDEPVCRICSKVVATKKGNTANLHAHLKHNHPTQFSQLGGNEMQSLRPDSQLSLRRLVDKVNGTAIVQFATSQKKCCPYIQLKSQHLEKCCKRLTDGTNCLRENTCNEQPFYLLFVLFIQTFLNL